MRGKNKECANCTEMNTNTKMTNFYLNTRMKLIRFDAKKRIKLVYSY